MLRMSQLVSEISELERKIHVATTNPVYPINYVELCNLQKALNQAKQELYNTTNPQT